VDQRVVFSTAQCKNPGRWAAGVFLTEPEAGSVADVDRPQAEAEPGRHAAHHIATAIVVVSADISDAETVAEMTVAEVVAVMPSTVSSTVTSAVPVRRSGGRSQRHRAEGSCGNKSKGNFT
jgi:hypothetical protein